MKISQFIFVLFFLSSLLSINACDDSATSRNSVDLQDTETTLTACQSAPGTVDCECTQKADCNANLLCDVATKTCRKKNVCDDMACEASQVCQPVDETNAACRYFCDPGFVLNEPSAQCRAMESTSCIHGGDNSILDECRKLYRNCEDLDGTAHCGGCFSGYTMSDGICRPVQTCVSLGCAQNHRLCNTAGANEDAQCANCEPGYIDLDGVCVLNAGKTCDAAGENSIRDTCSQLNRICVAGIETNGAWCGTCKDGYHEDELLGECILARSCDEMDCQSQNRGCEETPNAMCTDCIKGTVENAETGECEEILNCEDLQCPQGTKCEPAVENAHAYCFDDHGCAENQLWNAHRGVCVDCPVCGDDEGESNTRWPHLTNGTDRCICKTMPGYFFKDALELQIVSCDRDGDGWVRSDALIALSKDADDPIRANARCDVRKISSFVLENQKGDVTDVPLQSGAMLVEPPLLDDDTLLRQAADTFYGNIVNGRRLYAAELNPLTKACTAVISDFNQNGISDVKEKQSDALQSYVWTDTMDFLPMSYFMELYNAWYEPAESGGVYHIQEKSSDNERNLVDDLAIGQVVYLEDSDWQQCTTLLSDTDDADGAPSPDFSRYTDAYMTLSNKYRCVVVEKDDSAQHVEGAFTITENDISAACVTNTCWANENSVSRPPEANPYSPELECSPVAETPGEGASYVGWLSVDGSLL